MLPIDVSSRQEKMIREQIVARGVRDERVLEAMRWVPRERFFPDAMRDHAFDDAAAAIGCGQTISQPYIVALMTEALHLQPTHRVLEIGTGSGYQAAVLAKLAADVYTVERVKTLLDDAFERLGSLHVRNVHLRFGDGSLGWPERAPFDRILVTAATPRVARDVLLQLRDGGVCVAPVGDRDQQELVRFVKRSDVDIERHVICGVRFVPLLGEGGFQA
jgi:protein-L-isoaspartate(D-aspartate) O-methyltransferase